MAPVLVTRGLVNIANSCYVNAVLQILARSPQVITWVYQYRHTGEGSMRDCILCILKYTIVEMRKVSLVPFVPIKLLRWIGERDQAFQAGKQGDPHELLIFLLEQAGFDMFQHEEIEQIEHIVDGNMEEQIFTIPPQGVGTYHLPAIGDAGHDSTKTLLEDYISISNSRICVEGDGRICVQRWFSTPPKMLMMKLDRFLLINNVWNKNCRKCIVDNEISIRTIDNIEFKYEICGVINRIGVNPSGGHYVADVFDDGKWYSYSDEQLKTHDETDANSYLVFYKQRCFDEINDESVGMEDDVAFDEDDLLQSVDENMQSSTPADDCWSKNCDPQIKAGTATWRSKFSNKVHMEWLTKTRLLLMCIPKVCGGSTFKESYTSFQDSEETALYTITYKNSNFYYKVLGDPLMKDNYNVYSQDIGTKFGKKSVPLWVAEDATCYILNTRFGDRKPRLEFFFDMHPQSIIPSCIRQNWQTVQRNVSLYIDRCLTTRNLFCLEGCSKKCIEENVSFHRSIRNMNLITPLNAVAQQSSMDEWRFADFPSILKGHPLQMLLTLDKINYQKPICTQLVNFLMECEIGPPTRNNVYFLMVVESAMHHTPRDLLRMWKSKNAKFAVYVGQTKTGLFRKAHLLRNASNPTPVAKILTDNSTVYLVTSREHPNYKEGALAEAQLIAVLRRFQKEEEKTGIQLHFRVLNRNLPLLHLFNSNVEAKNSCERFIQSGKRPFRFLNEPYTSINDEAGILQQFLVSKVIRKPTMKVSKGGK